MGWLSFALVLSATLVGSSGCKDNKDPLTPDNPSADPLMLDAGMPGAPDTPAEPTPGAAPQGSAAPTAK
jgi:hypothetical protein